MALEQYEPIIQEAAKQFRIDPELIRRMIRQESAGRSNALSSAGAQGLMQLMPGTAKDMGVTNLSDPRENIFGGTKYLRQLFDKYGEQDLPKVLAAYNAGPGAVDKYGGVPPFKETQDYHTRILAGYQPPFPEGEPSQANLPSPLGEEAPQVQPMPIPQTQTQEFSFDVEDPDTGRKYTMVMGEDVPPTEDEAREFIAQFEKENPAEAAIPEQDKFKSGVLEQSQAAQAVQNPGGMWQGLKASIMASGGDPIKMMSQMLAGEAQGSVNRVTEELDVANEAKDPVTRFARGAGALAAGIPVFGELVKPMRESIPTSGDIDEERVAGNLVGAGVDAALARFTPPAAMTGISAGARGMTQAGSAIAQNASNRIARNTELGPVGPREIARDIFSKRGLAALAATAVNPSLGALVGGAAGVAEIGKLAGRSQGLARAQQRLGRSMMSDNPPELWQGANILPPDKLNPALLPDEALSSQTDEFDIDPNILEPPNRVPTPEELWEDIPLDETPSYQGGLEPWDATKGSQTRPAVSAERTELPEIKGKEGKKLLGEDQNRVSRFGKKVRDEESLDLDPLDNKDIDLDEPEIVSHGNKLIDTKRPPEAKKKVEVSDKTIPFADLESGNRVKTKSGKEGTLESFDEKSVTVKWDNGSRTRIARKAVEKVEAKKVSPKGETDLEKAAREASESIDEPIGSDSFTKEPQRGHRATNKPKVEPQYPEAQKRLPTYKVSGEPTPRSDLTNPRMTGQNPRELGLNDRAIRSSKVGWQVNDKIIRKELSEGRKHVQINIDDLLRAAEKDVKRMGRADSEKLAEAKNFLAGKTKLGDVFTPEISVENGRLIIDDGYHRLAAAKEFGERSAPVRIPLEMLDQLKKLGIQFRDLTPK